MVDTMAYGEPEYLSNLDELLGEIATKAAYADALDYDLRMAELGDEAPDIVKDQESIDYHEERIGYHRSVIREKEEGIAETLKRRLELNKTDVQNEIYAIRKGWLPLLKWIAGWIERQEIGIEEGSRRLRNRERRMRRLVERRRKLLVSVREIARIWERWGENAEKAKLVVRREQLRREIEELDNTLGNV